MAINEFDDMLEQEARDQARNPAPAPRKPNQFDQILAEENTSAESSMRQQQIKGWSVAPDRAADIVKLAARTGLPVEMIERNYEDIKTRAKLADTPYSRMLKETPALASWLQQPLNASISEGDTAQLGALERVTQIGKNVVGAVEAAGLEFSSSVWSTLRSLAELNPFAEQRHPAWIKADTPVDVAAAFAKSAAVLKADAARVRPQANSFVESAIYSGIESFGQNVPGLVMAMLGGGAPMIFGTMGATTYGGAYEQARSQGLAPLQAAVFGAQQGAIEIATEFLPASKVMEDLAKKTGFLKFLAHQLVTEVPGEEIATALQDLTEWTYLPANKDRTLGDYLRDRPSAAAATVISTIVAAGGTSALARVSQHFVERLTKAAGESETIKRSPEAALTFLEAATKDTATSTLYAPIDTFTTYWQSKGVDPRQVATELTGNSQAYDEAIASGADLAIPTAKYAVKIAPTEHAAFFEAELRLAPGMQNGRESEQFAERLKNLEPGQPAEPTPAERVEMQLTAQLEAGGATSDVARKYAGLHRSAFGELSADLPNAAQLEKAGISGPAGNAPDALYSKYGLQVSRPALDPKTAKPAGEGKAGEAQTPAGGTKGPEAASAPPGGAQTAGAETVEPPNVPRGTIEQEALNTPDAGRETIDGAMRDALAPIAAAAGATLRGDGEASATGGESDVESGRAGASNEPGGAIPEAGRGLLDGARERGGTAEVGARLPRGGSEGAGDGGVDAIPPTYAPRFALLLGGARERGYAGSDDSLADLFLEDLAEAQGIALDSSISDDEGDTGRSLLKAIAAAGGLGVEVERGRDSIVAGRVAQGGMAGEIETLLEAFEPSRFQKKKNGKRAGKWITRKNTGPVGIPGVVKRTGGRSVDAIREALSEDPRWEGKFDNLADLLEAVRAAVLEVESETSGAGAARAAVDGVLDGYLQVRPDTGWWATGPIGDAGAADTEAVDMLKDVGDEAAGVAGDTSFDVREFDQDLFDLFAHDEDSPVDVLATGELQPRLPGDVGAVRDQEVKDQPIAELKDEFRLTAPEETQETQTTLFQSEIESGDVDEFRARGLSPAFIGAYERVQAALEAVDTATSDDERAKARTELDAADAKLEVESQREAERVYDTKQSERERTRDILEMRGDRGHDRGALFAGGAGLDNQDVQAIARRIKAQTGPALVELKLAINPDDTLYLEGLAVERGAQRAGVGSQVMRTLTTLADTYGLTMSLTPASKGGKYGTESAAKLREYYARFGFVENTGRHRDLTIDAKMYRAPSARATELDQPFFHGTPHDVDRFSTEHVGSGEGGASFGWGLYFAENKRVAESYRDALAPDVITVDGQEMPSISLASSTRDASVQAAYMVAVNGGVDKASAHNDTLLEVIDDIEDPKKRAAASAFRHDVGTAIEALRGKDVKREPRGSIYQVEIADEHVAKMLDWDVPFDQQPESVQKGLRELWARYNGAEGVNRARPFTAHSGATGEAIYAAIAVSALPGGNQKAMQEAASKDLESVGIPGIKYFDAMSRSQSDGTRNVVVFNDKIITLTHKDGTPVTQQERREFFQGARTKPGAAEKKAEGRRGAIRFGADRQFSIDLFERADLSTFLHESGHFFLEVYGDVVDRILQIPPADMTDGQRQRIVDYRSLLNELGVKSRAEIGKKEHEQFARSFEAYLMEGKAPSLELRAAFASFRAWLVGLYRSLTALNVRLTPEVRRIMGRMLASDEAIRIAERSSAVDAMFTTAESAKVPPAEFALYTQHIADASRQAREKLEVQLLAEVAREQEADYKARRAAVRDAVAAEVNARPEIRAIAAIRRGTTPEGGELLEGLAPQPMKLSRQTLVALFGADRLKRLPKPALYVNDGGVDPEIVADMFGYSSADAMLTAIEQSGNPRAIIEQETERRMQAEYGSILLDGTIHERARAALANESREEVVRAELRMLNNLRAIVKPALEAGAEALRDERRERDYERRWIEAETKLRIAIAEGKGDDAVAKERAIAQQMRAQIKGGAARIEAALPTITVIRQIAADRIARTRVRDLSPETYYHASVQASAKATAHAARQEYDKAIEAKQQELVALEMYRQSSTAREDVQKRVTAALALGQAPALARLGKAGQGYVDQVRGILDRYEFVRVPLKDLDRRANLRKWVESLEGDGLPADLPEEVLNDALRINYRELTVEQLVGVTDGLQQIAHIARLKTRLLKAKDQREFDAVRDGVVDSIRANNKKRKAGELDVDSGFKHFVDDVFVSHTKIGTLARVLDGGVDGGAMWEAVVRPLNAAGDDEQVRRSATAKEARKILDRHYTVREQSAFATRFEVPAIKDSLTKEKVLAIALNWGNQTSRDRLTSDPTRKWTTAQIEEILKTLDRRDWQYVQDVWDHIDTFWPEIAAKQERVTGLAPEKVDALPVKTAFGEFRGGYYPLVYDGRRSARAQGFESATTAKLQQQAAYVATTTRRGHVEARKSNVKLSVQLDLGVMFAHFDQVIHDLTHHEALIDATRVLRDSEVSKAIYETRGDNVFKQFTAALADIASGGKMPGQNPFDRAATFMRTGTQIAGLGYNLWTALQQPLGLFNGASRVGPVWVMRGMARWLRSAATMQKTTTWIAEVSPFMRERHNTATQDIADLRTSYGKPGGWFDTIVRTVSADRISQDAITDSFLWHIGLAQRVADVPTWLGAYEKATHHGEAHERAVALADQAVIDSQGSGQIKDLSRIQRGGPIAKMFMVFYSYGATVFNSTYEVAARTRWSSPSQVGTFLGHMSLLYIMPALGTVTLAALFKGGGGDDLEEYLREIGQEVLSTALNTMVLVRELQGITGIITGHGSKGVRGYEGPAGARPVALVTHAAQQIAQEKVDEALVRSLIAPAGIIFRFPAGQVQRTIDGIIALEEGKASNPLAIFFGAPKR